MSLLHTVLISFDTPLGPDQLADFDAQIRSWPEAIGGFEHLAVGPPLYAERAQGYQHLLHMVVADEEALERYQVHPVHQHFATWVRERGGRVLAFDYLLDDGTVVHAGSGPGGAGSADAGSADAWSGRADRVGGQPATQAR